MLCVRSSTTSCSWHSRTCFSAFLMLPSLRTPAIWSSGMSVAKGPSGIFSWLTWA